MLRSLRVLLATLLAACSAAPVAPEPTVSGDPHASHRPDHGGHHSFGDAERWAAVFDDPARDAWQRPDVVLAALELTPALRVADIGAGTGYFSVRLARAVPAGEVIATDTEPDMVRYLAERADREQLPNLRARLVTAKSAGLDDESVDRILIVHVWHHLDDRVAYGRELLRALRPGGKLVIDEFDPTATRGPPAQLRIAPETLVAELTAAGFAAQLSAAALPDRYLVEARRP